MAMIVIDGAEGEGGGQIIRSSLALSIVTGQDVTLINIRARREKPGLRQQHLTAVRAAARICRGKVTGAEVGSTSIHFQPGALEPGDHTFDIGTAGSTSLVLQTIFLPLLTAEGPSRITLIGGTHNPLAPTFEFLENCYFPALRQMGLNVHGRLVRPGFYPAGGGEVVFEIDGHESLSGLNLDERGRLKERRMTALVARLPRHIGERECATFCQKSGWPAKDTEIKAIGDSRSPGNVVTVRLDFEHVAEVATAFGRLGVPAEVVADEAWSEVKAYLASTAPVGIHLADQLLLPLGWLAARGTTSVFHTLPLSLHSTTHIDILQRFLPIVVDVERLADQRPADQRPADQVEADGDVRVTCRAA